MAAPGGLPTPLYGSSADQEFASFQPPLPSPCGIGSGSARTLSVGACARFADRAVSFLPPLPLRVESAAFLRLFCFFDEAIFEGGRSRDETWMVRPVGGESGLRLIPGRTTTVT